MTVNSLHSTLWTWASRKVSPRRLIANEDVTSERVLQGAHVRVMKRVMRCCLRVQRQPARCIYTTEKSGHFQTEDLRR